MEEPAYNGTAGKPQGTIEDRLDLALTLVPADRHKPLLIHITREDWDELNAIWSERKSMKLIVLDHAGVHLFPAAAGAETCIEWAS